MGDDIVYLDASAPTPDAYLWEQIVASVDPAEVPELLRVVGLRRAAASEDVYAEVRALRAILEQYTNETQQVLNDATPADRLLSQELEQLVAHLRAHAKSAGRSVDALLSATNSKQRRKLENLVLGGAPERPQSAHVDARGTGAALLRARTAERHRPTSAAVSSIAALGAAPTGGTRHGDGSSECSRPSTGRGATGPASSSRPSSPGYAPMEHLDVSASGGGSDVIAALQAALEEERRALLAQAEQLRLSLDDEAELRDRTLPLTLSELQGLKQALQETVARAQRESRDGGGGGGSGESRMSRRLRAIVKEAAAGD